MQQNPKNFIIAITLSLVILIGWNYLFPTPKPLPKQTITEIKKDNETNVTEKKDENVKKEEQKETITETVDFSNISEEIVTIKTVLYDVVFSNLGGSVKTFTLNGKKYTEGKEKQNIQIINEDIKNKYSFSFNMIENEKEIFKRETPFLIKEKDNNKVVFQYENDNFKITKTYTVGKTDYQLHLITEIENKQQKSFIFNTNFLISAYYNEGVERTDPMGHTGKRPIYREVNESMEWVNEDDFDSGVKKKKLSVIGLDETYFTSLLKINQPDLVTLRFEKNKSKYYVSMLSEPLNIDPQKTLKLEYELYNGPKILENLKQIDAGDVIDYGFVAVISKLILWLLLFLYSFLGNYGLSLIFITLIVKTLLYPLTKASYVSMHKMKELKPELDKLKEKLGSDKEKLGRETMALYSKNGVNPLSGCLPMLLQMPIWFGLYRAIQHSVELYNEPFILWITDLSIKDPLYILPVVMGILMFFQQKMSSGGMDPMQAKIMLYTLPVVFTVFMLVLPSGLNLYIAVNTIISILQQKYINHKLDLKKLSMGSTTKPSLEKK